MNEKINSLPKYYRYLGLIPGLIALVVYFNTTCRSIWIGDSGEFALALKTLGVCHPPGYPLFTLGGRIAVMLLPFVRPIFAVGLFNILLASATVTILYYFLSRYMSRISAILTSLIWAFTPIYWAETAGVEIYALNMLLLMLTFFAVTGTHRHKWLIGIYLFGLSLTNHPGALAIFLPLLYLYFTEKQYRLARHIPYYAALLIVAASVYLYLPLRAIHDPIANWGDPSSLGKLISHMTLGQYKGWIDYSLSNLLLSLKLFWKTIMNSWGLIGVLASLLGVVFGFIYNRIITVMALLFIAVSLMLSSSHLALNYEPFYIPAMFGALLLLSNLIIWLEGKPLRSAGKYLINIAMLIACLTLLISNYNSQDRSDYTLAEVYAKQLIDNAEEGVMFTAGDINSFPSLYLRYAENYRPELEIYDRSVRLNALFIKTHDLNGRNALNYYEARQAIVAKSGLDCYLAKNHYVNEPDWLTIDDSLYSHGPLYAIGFLPDREPTQKIFSSYYNPGDVLSLQLLINLDLARGEHLLKQNNSDKAAALASFNLALSHAKTEPRATVLNNLGIFYRRAGYHDLALSSYNLALSKPIITNQTKADIKFNISNVMKDRGNSFTASGDYVNAVSSFEKALEYDKNNPTLLRNVGIIYARVLGDTARAKSYLYRYLQTNPSDNQVAALLRSLN